MRKFFFICMAGVLFAAGAFFFFKPEVDLSKYAHLKEPQITRKPDIKVMQVVAKGDPNETAGRAFGLLYGAYFDIEKPADWHMTAPRARWDAELEAPPETWTGRFAIQVPPQLETLEGDHVDGELKIEITTWEYGEVAEVMHVGPYDAEKPTIERLLKHVKDSGYEVVGKHEEMYLKGPGMFLKGDPADYHTVLSYQVRKLAAPEAAAAPGAADESE